MIGVLIDELGSQEAAAHALGKSATWLSKRKRVLGIPAVAAAVERGEISLDHAYDVITRSRDEGTTLEHLERVRTGGQNQGTTRSVLTPRPRQVMHDMPLPASPPPVSVRNHHDRQLPDPPPRDSTISARNREVFMPPVHGRAPNGEETVVLDTLATIQLSRDGERRATRQMVICALRADLVMLEGDE